MRTSWLAIYALAAAPALLGAQEPIPVLTIEEAVELARRNNPAYLQVANNRRTADAQVRTAYGGFLPGADASLTSQFREGGTQFFNGAALGANSDILQSFYDIGLSMQLSTSTFIAPRQARANRVAVEADVGQAAATLRNNVTQQYLTVLQAQENAALQDTLVVAAEQQLALAQARERVGAATLLDVRRAEVTLGQQRVSALQAHNTVEIEKLRLFQQLGVMQPAGVRLTSQFPVNDVDYTLEEVLEIAERQSPYLRSAEAREKAARMNLRMAQGLYSPTLRLSTGWGGYTRQFVDDDFPVEDARQSALFRRASCFSQDSLRVAAGLPSIGAQCSAIDFTSTDAAAIRAANSQYPFDFTKSPWSFSATLSIPLFDGFSREQRVQEAAAARADARYEIRARELQLSAEVTAAYLNLQTARQTVALQEDNAAKAREELVLAEERYRVGAATFLDVTTARASYEQAESDRINAIYDYHKAYAALESAVGRPLR